MFDIFKFRSLDKMYNLKINSELLKSLNDTRNQSINRMCNSQHFALLDINGGPAIPYEFTKIVFIGIISFLAGSYFSFSYVHK